ncbi:signal recognition particle-docking protein FtsY [soil metagenome]
MAFLSGLISKLKSGLTKTRETLVRSLRSLILGRTLDESLIADVERMLLDADVGVEGTKRLIDAARADFRAGKLRDSRALLSHLKAHVRELLELGPSGSPDSAAAAPGTSIPAAPDSTRVSSLVLRRAATGPTVILVTGVNGAGKTTTIAKLTNLFRKEDKTVLLAACDTFRAGAVRQLEIWAERLGVEIVKGQHGGDPAAVAFDACRAAAARNIDILIIDTAGRLQTQDPLMRQLEKIYKVIGKSIPGAPHETLLVLDATTGQNALRQAVEFSRSAPITGIALTKLDGTAKGGIVIAIRAVAQIPVKLVGTGETVDDFSLFDPDAFVEAMFSE